jgi:hypothetical protein
MNESPSALTLGRTDYRTALLGISLANVIVVLFMAILGGRFFVSPSIIEIHGYIGNLLFMMVVAQAGLLFISKPGGPLGKPLLGLTLLAVLLVVGQIGLGYSGRESVTALTLHIPNGVLIFGISAAILAQLPYARATNR